MPSVIFYSMAFKGFIIRVKKAKKPSVGILFKVASLVCIMLFACAAGVWLGTYFAIRQNLPSISLLEEFEPNIITYIYSDEGEVIGEYAIEKRIEIPYEEIPEVVKNAIIATEDPRFYSHKGFDPRGALRALREDIKTKLGGKSRKLHGGSTISQQLARDLFLHRRQTLRRKFKEVLLARQIERKYSKHEILTMYCNQFNLGHGSYGVEAASQLYFGKNVSELAIEEAAMIVGILRGPSLYSPYRNREYTHNRRDHVIRRLVDEGYLTEEEGEEVKARPFNVMPLRRGDTLQKGIKSLYNFKSNLSKICRGSTTELVAGSG
jgi:penicillin-binding protein 1A